MSYLTSQKLALLIRLSFKLFGRCPSDTKFWIS